MYENIKRIHILETKMEMMRLEDMKRFGTLAVESYILIITIFISLSPILKLFSFEVVEIDLIVNQR